MAELTQSLATEVWRYDPDTGFFFWRVSPRYKIAIGDRAGNFDGKYWRLRYKKKNYKASRVAWLIMTGLWPNDQIDHVNGNKVDDRFCNLREATNAENCRNIGVRKTNRLGIKGVSKNKYSYTAVTTLNGKRYHIGSFRTPEEAALYQQAAAHALHGKFHRAG